MAKRINVKKSKRSRNGRDARFVGDAAVSMVRNAAVLLEDEMKTGIKAAQAVQRRLQTERRIEAADFNGALSRFQADARDIVTSLNKQLEGSALTANLDLARKFVAKSGDMIDLAVGVVSTGAELTNALLQQNLPRQDAGQRRKPRR